jgi:hypothetical protein
MASINCSVILIISCRRAVFPGDNKKKIAKESEKKRENSINNFAF